MKTEHKNYILQNIGNKSIKELSLVLNLKESKIKRFLERHRDEYTSSPLGINTKGRSSPPAAVKFISVILIVIAGFAVYANSLNGKFIWDDDSLIKDNVYIKDWSHIRNIFTEDIRAGAGVEGGAYRPLQMVTYIIDYSLWGLNVKGYHLSNILFHILAALGIYWLITILYEDAFLSLMTSLFFVTHPIHTEAVSYIAGRSDSLALFFMLIAVIFYIKNLRLNSIAMYLAMGSSFILALLSKESSLILPAILVLYHYTFKKKLKIKDFMFMLGIVFSYILLRVMAFKSFTPDPLSDPTTLLQRLIGFFVAISNYIRLLLLPFGLHMEYGCPLFSPLNPRVVAGAAMFFSLLLYTFIKRRDDRLFFFSVSWFFITLLPVSNLYPVNAYMAEHWLYVPSIGFFLILAAGLNRLYKAKILKNLAVVSIIGLLTFYSYLTIQQNKYWKDPITFHKRTIKYAPDSVRAHVNLANEYSAIGRNEEAIALYKKAIEIDPSFADAYTNLGIAYDLIGKKTEAIAMLKKAIEVDPRYGRAYNNIAVFYYYQKDYKLAIQYCDKAYQLGFVNTAFLDALKPYRK
jgi:tetratricopeptide (TPR) repeat protein